jgi:hypothetical protein
MLVGWHTSAFSGFLSMKNAFFDSNPNQIERPLENSMDSCENASVQIQLEFKIAELSCLEPFETPDAPIPSKIDYFPK